MKLNAGKTKAMTVSWSRTLDPHFSYLLVNEVQLESVDQVEILGMVVDSKLTFELHVWSTAKRASRSLGISRRAWRIFADPGLIVHSFGLYLLPLLE